MDVLGGLISLVYNQGKCRCKECKILSYAVFIAARMSPNQLTPCSKTLLKKLMVLQLGKKFHAVHATQTCVVLFTQVHHLPLS